MQKRWQLRRKENIRIATLGELISNQGKVEEIGGSGKFRLPE
jgi:hypothetical protein